MALPSSTDLQLLNTSWLGKPFVQVEAKALYTVELDVSWLGKPFVGASGAVAPTYPAYLMFGVF